ncbi:thiamine-phosphate kinase [Paracidobacterium acidisoli]|uniref:Thiamine-monophosphate kinase n=1 Tax=Paracidobacterium acidisoli TaxID=2303751 RepID=A0A372IMG9_9BACT|nr:thiamine-phosphate kinase [Paracidobacterium acidisoli]MBT9332557.1 thiamine-phosphate kinase [Paracidobacterium acidisoli]
MPRNPRTSPAPHSVPFGERALISAIRARAGSGFRGVPLGIGDDCAILRPAPGSEIVVTTDLSLEQVHFRRDWHTPESAGHRCLARGLSDLAAMGARPMAAFLSLSIPSDLISPEDTSRTAGRRKPAKRDVSWTDRFLDGLLQLAAKYKVPLAGGDTAQSPQFDEQGRRQSGLAAADIVLIGQVRRGQALLRSGARPGQVIYVTGSLGGSAAELLALGRDPSQFATLTKGMNYGHPHLFPEPRLRAGEALAARKWARAAIDLSDGLSTDLLHICEASDVAAEIDEAALPIHPLARQAEHDGWIPSALGLALHGGEDYELLFTANRSVRIPRSIAGVSIHPIGLIQSRRQRHPMMVMNTPAGKHIPVEAGGWEHFTR